jgi:hypothetical protein
VKLSALFLLTVLPSVAFAQSSVSGVVKDSVTGEPLANYIVTTSVKATEVRSTTDDQGHYKLSDLPPGSYRIDVDHPQSFGHTLTRQITLASQDLEGIDFSFVVEGSITGKVVDENREPVPGIMVSLVSREYYLGAIGYFFPGIASETNDRGEYTLAHVKTGHPYFILAEKRNYKLAAHSEVPLNPKLRRRVPMRTWYPNVTAKEGAVALVLSPGERRDGIDIEVKKSPSYCIDGTLVSPHGAGPIDFSIEPQQPSSGSYAGGGSYVGTSSGTTSADGQFRICDLYPGTYRFTASENAQSTYIATMITITDRDLDNLKIAAMPGIPLDGEVVLDGEPPQKPVTSKLNVWLQPLLHPGLGNNARSDIPGPFSIPGLLLDEYIVHPSFNVPGLYLKDVTYGGKSVRSDVLRWGSADGGLRISLGHDGAKLSVRAIDKDGNPVADMRVLMLPAEAGSEAAVQSMLLTGATDQFGNYTSRTLAPGKYYVAASSDSFDATPESIGKIWRSRSRFKEVELAPNGTAQVSLEPVTIE